jgi:hypothetical protein
MNTCRSYRCPKSNLSLAKLPVHFGETNPRHFAKESRAKAVIAKPLKVQISKKSPTGSLFLHLSQGDNVLDIVFPIGFTGF